MDDEDPFLKKQPQQSRSRALIDAVLEATDRLLATRPEDVSLQGIARRAGVGIASLYDYFGDAERLWGSYLRRLTRKNFETLLETIHGTRGRPFTEVLPEIIDASWGVYFDAPGRTRAVIAAVSRLGLTRMVIEERDRFALALAHRVVEEHPQVTLTSARETAEFTSDLLMGIVTAELWRERDDAARERIRRHVHDAVADRVRVMLATAG